MKRILLAAALAVGAGLAQAAEIVKVPVSGSVEDAMDRLVSVVEGAGATVFARVDHAGGAGKIGETLAPMQLLMFGNPRIGTPALQDAPMAGLMLPLRVLAYEDADGAVWLAYEDPAAMLSGVGATAGADYVGKIAGALKTLTAKAAGD